MTLCRITSWDSFLCARCMTHSWSSLPLPVFIPAGFKTTFSHLHFLFYCINNWILGFVIADSSKLQSPLHLSYQCITASIRLYRRHAMAPLQLLLFHQHVNELLCPCFPSKGSSRWLTWFARLKAKTSWLFKSLSLSISFQSSKGNPSGLPFCFFPADAISGYNQRLPQSTVTQSPSGGEYRIRTDDPLLAKQVL